MSGTTTICPVDTTITWCPDVGIIAGELYPVEPEPTPDPGDPNTTWVPAEPRRLGRRAQLVVCRPVWHTPITELVTAAIGSCSFQHGPGAMDAVVASDDPAFELFAARATMCRGHRVYEPDFKGVEVAAGVDGKRFWGGILGEPQTGSGGQWQLRAASGGQVFNERELGETEQRDYYEGRGSFPTHDLTGWSFSDNVTHQWNETDPYQGSKSLQLKASGPEAGFVYGPWVGMQGQDGQTRYPVASAVLRIDSDLVMQVICQVAVPGDIEVSDWSLANRGISDNGERRSWQIVAGQGQIPPHSRDYQVRAVISVPAGLTDWVDVDLVRLQWPTLTGYPSDFDLSLYLSRILRDAQYGPGGSTYGIPEHTLSLTGVKAHLNWAHQDDHPIFEAYQSVAEMAGGPDWWITPAWRMLIAARRGVDRRDRMLSFDNIITGEFTFDPAGEVDEYRALTDLGSGPYRHVHSFSTRRRPDRRRIRQLTQTPIKMTYDGGERWAEGQAEWAAREPSGGKFTVSFDEGLGWSVGDGALCAWDDGVSALWGAVRVASLTFDFPSDTCVVEVGRDPVVAL